MSQATLDRPAQSPPQVADVAQHVRRLVQQNSRRWKLLAVLEGLAFTVSALLAYLWLVFWLDNVLHLPTWGRAAASLGLVACVIWLATRLIGRWKKLRLSEDQVALAIERRTPGGVQNRLINALQIARDPDAHHADLKRAVVQENIEQIAKLELEQAAAMKPAVVRLTIAGALIAVGIGFYLSQPERFTNAASRIFMPLKDINPYFRTTLIVEPGDVEARGDVPIRIRIQGERPAELVVLYNATGERGSQAVPVPSGADVVEHTFKSVERSMTYAVRGNDFTTPFYRIDVPMPSHVSLVRAVYHFPEYTKLQDKKTETASGDLESLTGSRVELNYLFDQPTETATLVLDRIPAADATGPVEDRVELKSISPTEFRGELLLVGLTGYQIETRQTGRMPHLDVPYSIRLLTDEPPKLELTGLERKGDVSVDSTLPLRAAALDDYGLAKVGIFYRKAPTVAPQADSPATDVWTSLQTWTGDNKLEFHQEFPLSLLYLEAAEGDQFDVLLRAQDSAPSRTDRWTDGTVFPLQVGGEGATLQLQYEQILRTQAEILAIIDRQRKVMSETSPWIRKLDFDSGLKWEDPKQLEELHTSIAAQAKAQEQVRQAASQAARTMVEQAGNLRFSLGMLADTEMVRAIRILESVPTRDQASAKKTALSDEQLTHERVLASLQDILDQYGRFRADWELAHMTAFVKMLADRQTSLRDQSVISSSLKEDPLADRRKASAGRRQLKVQELTGLSKNAFARLAQNSEEVPEVIVQSFAAASESLGDGALDAALKESAALATEGKWTEAAKQQTIAAESLTAIHAALRKAQTEAARQALAALEELAKTNLAAQKELERLKAGTEKAALKLPEGLSITDIIAMRKITDKRKGEEDNSEGKVEDYLLTKEQEKKLNPPDRGIRQEFDRLKLGDSRGKSPSFPKQSDREANTVLPPVQEEFQDLVGELLEEADEMRDKFDSYNLNAAFNINEPGEVGKQAGDLNSTAAAAATGNKKPPVNNVGGISRSGRRGARAHGMVVGEESINRRGRDQVQEGQERVADQAGTIREQMSDDPQKDTSTGVGGKKVESDDTKFSVNDVGKWTDDMAKRMGKPQKKNSIVERQDGRMDPRVAEMLKDLTSEQEQIIERVKSIKKDLKNLYLPTDHIDEVLAELTAQLDRLKESPSPEIFRLQQQSLDKLRSTLRVFHQASASFQPSVLREQAVRGRVLDESARQTIPGYEQAVKEYYTRLSTTVTP